MMFESEVSCGRLENVMFVHERSLFCLDRRWSDDVGLELLGLRANAMHKLPPATGAFWAVEQ